jgi:hypothetical protein
MLIGRQWISRVVEMRVNSAGPDDPSTRHCAALLGAGTLA